MENFKGTKGKWEVKKTRNGHSMISGKDWDGFCKVYRITEGGYDASSDIHYANVKLIAAAPDLLEALIQLKNWTCALKDWSGGTSLDPPIEIAIEAIKKATE